MNYLMVIRVLESIWGPWLSQHLCSCFSAYMQEGMGLFWFLHELSIHHRHPVLGAWEWLPQMSGAPGPESVVSLLSPGEKYCWVSYDLFLP